MSDNKYKLFRNFMVNELGISRDDIKEWTMQAIQETVVKALRGIDVEKLVYEKAVRAFNNNVAYGNLEKDLYAKALRKLLDEKLDLQITLKPEKEVEE